jgi:hypothetical protein
MVVAKDADGNTATSYTGTVTFSSSDAKAVLPANYTFVSTDRGVHTSSATFKTAGTQSLTATDTVTSSITGTQSGIVVNPGSASVLVVTGFPSPIAHGTAGTFTVTVQDAYGNTVTGYRGTLKLSSSDTAASPPANYTFTSTDAGVHTFTATLNTAGTQSITATDTVNSTITGTDSGIQVTMIPADRVFRDWPTSEGADIPRELLETGEVVEQLVALAVVRPAISPRVVADQGLEELRGSGYDQSAVGAAVAVLCLYWRDRTTQPREPKRKRKGLERP